MSRIVFFAFTSLDGYTTDREGNIDWHTPDDDVHAYINQLEGAYSDHIYSESSYHIMKYWGNPPAADLENPEVRDYAELWQGLHKTVISSSLTGLDANEFTVLPTLDVDRIRGLKATATGDIQVGDSELAATLLANGLLDRIHLGVVPVILGGGAPLSFGMNRRGLTLTDSRAFRSGWIFLTYDIQRTS